MKSFVQKIKLNFHSSKLLPLSITVLLFSMNSCELKDIDPPPPDVDFIEEPTVEVLPFEDLLDLVQERTFNFFWDLAEPNSGLALENSSENAFGGSGRDIISIAGSGFGISSYPIAVKRGWVTREQAIERLTKNLTFLENMPTYHGAFSHWHNARTNMTQPYSAIEDGGDIVETAFLIQGLLINRQYFSKNTIEENSIRNRITTIYENVEWDWYTQGQKKITWHWSPNHGYYINLDVKGWNETLIVYILAAGSPTHPIDKETYDNGWASNGAMVNGSAYLGITLPLGEAYGGPLFFSHYSFIGLDPRNLSDRYASNYFKQNRAHSLINYEYCKNNPLKYVGYGGDSWGITAGLNYNGYSAHSPTNDLGVISPTAALSSFPYTPEESKKALGYFYYQQNEKLWGEYGFYDAFSEEFNWFSDEYLAIDQGPIVAMIENYRTQLLWSLFMQDQDVKNGLNILEFSY